MTEPRNPPDEAFMHQALQLAAKGMYTTTPNPRVGCVIVKNGAVIGSGTTQPAGQNHAEIQALNDAREKGHDVRGATVYVTLEPCSHHGKTPPCTEALIAAGVGKVIAATEDPFPLVAGTGLTRLRAAGIAVECGMLATEAREMNIGFFSRVERGRPWVRLKVAASLDGKTALLNGQSQWITSSAARDDGHAWRARACAVLTGIGTVQHDDPLLTVRALPTPRQPRRIVVDSRLAISEQAHILEGGAWVFATQGADKKIAALQAAGTEVIMTSAFNGKVDLHAVMAELGKRQINEVHVEAGKILNGALLQSGLADELLVYTAPCILGEAQGMFALPALVSLTNKINLRFHEVTQIGEDLRIVARVQQAQSQ